MAGLRPHTALQHSPFIEHLAAKYQHTLPSLLLCMLLHYIYLTAAATTDKPWAVCSWYLRLAAAAATPHVRTWLDLLSLMLRPSLADDSGPQWKMKGRAFTLSRLYSSLLFSYVSSAKKMLSASGPCLNACTGGSKDTTRKLDGCWLGCLGWGVRLQGGLELLTVLLHDHDVGSCGGCLCPLLALAMRANWLRRPGRFICELVCR